MKNVRLLPVVVLAISALLVLKTLGLVTNGGYVLTGVRVAQAAGGGAAPSENAAAPTGEPTMEDTSPTLVDPSPTMAQAVPDAGGHGAPSAAAEHAEPAGEADAAAGHDAAPGATEASDSFCFEANAAMRDDGTVIINAASASAEGGGHGEPAADGEVLPEFAASMADCLPTGDAVPMQIDGNGGAVPLLATGAATPTEQQLLERLAARRTELEQFEKDLAMRASIVDAAEKRIEERTTTLAALEAQISTLVDQRQEMETGQFAGIVAMYETMKPKDAANIFNNLDMEVLLRVAKSMSPRKMAPILAVMQATRAQELTVRMAALADQPAAQMTSADLAALPQIVGQ